MANASASSALFRDAATTQCASSDVPSLRLLSDLADRSPLSLWRSSGTDGEALLSLLQSSVNAVASGGIMDKVDAVLEAVVNVSIASQTAAKSAVSATAGGETNELMAAIRAQTEDNEHAKSIPVDPKSFASKLGKACLPSLLAALARSGGTDPDARGNAARKLSHASTRCPSLVAGDIGVLGCLIKTCLALARIGSGSEDEDEANASLAALEVLASAVEVDDVRKRVALTSAMVSSGMEDLLRLSLIGEDGQSGAIRICSEYIVSGTDDDLDAWTSDPASLQDSSSASSWDGDDVSSFAESLLESFLRHLGGGAQTLPVVLPLVEQLMQSSPDQWRNYRAALSMLEGCLDAAPVAFAPHVPVAVETALKLSSHPCVRVQYQSIQLLGALCHADSTDDEEGNVQIRREHSGRILQALAQSCGSACSKVSAHASLALVSYCRGGDGKPDAGKSVNKESLVPYLADVLGALSSGPLRVDVTDPAAVNSGGVAVLVRAISAVACLADASGESFAPHYASVMPGLLGCSKFGVEFDQAGAVRVAPNATGHDFAQLRGSAVESATIVGQAVGTDNPDAFVPDAENIVQIILPLLNMAENGGDAGSVIPLDQILAASARIAAIMGDRYAPFLPSVLPHLLRRAREDAEVSVLEGDEAGLQATKSGLHQIDEDAGTESITVQLPGVGLKKLVMNTTQMQEKSQAARAVYEHARSMGASFGPHAEVTLGAFLPLVEFKYSAEVRSTGAQACGPVFDALCEYATQEKSAAHLPGQALPALSKAIARQIKLEDNDDPDTVFALADSLSEVFYSAHKHKTAAQGTPIAVLGAADSRAVVSQVVDIAKSCLERRSYLLSQMAGADGVMPDADELALLEEQLQLEADQLSELVNSIGYNIKSLKENFAPIFDQIVAPFFGQFLPATYAASPGADVRARVAAVCLFDDVIEHCGTSMASKYAAPLAEAVAMGIDDATNGDDGDLKSAAVYGVAQLARNAPKGVLDNVVQPILMQLIQIVQSEMGQASSKEDMDNPYLVEISASAVASLAVFDSSPYANANLPVDRASLMNLFLGVLPITEDPDEAKVCHSGLCDLIDSKTLDPTATPAVITLVAQILALAEGGEEDVATPSTISRLAGILRGVQEVSGGGALRGALSGMSEEDRNAVTKAMARSNAPGSSGGTGRGSSPISVVRMR